MRQVIGISVDQELLATIDDKRTTPNGQVPRSRFIEQLVKAQLEQGVKPSFIVKRRGP